jgi:hypothetical protein
MKKFVYLLPAILLALSINVDGKSNDVNSVTDEFITKQRLILVENTKGQGFGPQSPRNIDSVAGNSKVAFGVAPSYKEMNLCNIHLHKNAEHAGGQYVKYAGNGDGHGYQTGYLYSGTLTKGEVAPVSQEICPSKHGSLLPGDTIEIHYVHSSALVKPGPT